MRTWAGSATSLPPCLWHPWCAPPAGPAMLPASWAAALGCRYCTCMLWLCAPSCALPASRMPCLMPPCAASWPLAMRPCRSHAGRQPDLWAWRQPDGTDGLGAAAAQLAAGSLPWGGACGAQRRRGGQPKRVHGVLHAGAECTYWAGHVAAMLWYNQGEQWHGCELLRPWYAAVSNVAAGSAHSPTASCSRGQ